MKPWLKDFLLVELSALLLAMSQPIAFPWLDRFTGYIMDTGIQGVLAFFGMIPFLFVLEQKRGWRGLLWILLFSSSYFAYSLHWVNIAIIYFGMLPVWVSLIVFVLFMIVCGLFWTLGLGLGYRAYRRSGLPLSLVLPIAFVGGEIIRNYLFTGFPWHNLAYSQYANLPFIQSAGLWGIHGICFILVLSNALFYEYLQSRRGKLAYRWPRKLGYLLGGLVVFSYVYGFIRMGLNEPLVENAPKINVAMIQANIDQEIKNSTGVARYKVMEIYDYMTFEMVPKEGIDLVLWPEASYPFAVRHKAKDFKQYLTKDKDFEAPWPMLIGVPSYETTPTETKHFNTALLLDKKLNVLGNFDKSHLVPFGEYVPLSNILPIGKLVPVAGQFYPGHVGEGLTVNGHRFGVLICYEGIFPEISRAYAQAGVEFLVNLTNDAWYGVSAAPYQHLAMYVFRSIETRKATLRVANTGVTAVIDPSGHIRHATDIYTRHVVQASAPRLTERTVYSYIGDTHAWLCVLLVVFWNLAPPLGFGRKKTAKDSKRKP